MISDNPNANPNHNTNPKPNPIYTNTTLTTGGIKTELKQFFQHLNNINH